MAAAVALTVDEAADILDPPISAEELRRIITALGWQPAGYRHSGRAGRPAPKYDAGKIMKLHAALVPFLGNNVV